MKTIKKLCGPCIRFTPNIIILLKLKNKYSHTNTRDFKHTANNAQLCINVNLNFHIIGQVFFFLNIIKITFLYVTNK